MADTTEVTSDIVINYRAKPGKFLNSREMGAMLVKGLESLNIPLLTIHPKLNLELDKGQLNKELTLLMTDVKKRLIDPTAQVQSRFKKLLQLQVNESLASYRSRINTIQKDIAPFQRFTNITAESRFREFDSPKFKRVLASSRAGVDIEKAFGSKAAEKLTTYLHLQQQIKEQIIGINRELAKSSGFTTHDIRTQGQDGSIAVTKGTAAKFAKLAPSLRTIADRLAADTKQAGLGLSQTNLARLEKEKVSARSQGFTEARRLMKEEFDRRDRTAARARKRTEEGQLRTQGLPGRNLLATADLKTLGISKLIPVYSELERKIRIYNKLIARAENTDRKFRPDKGFIGKKKHEAILLNAELKKVQAKITSLANVESTQRLGGVSSAAEKAAADIGLADIGDRIIKRQGGLGKLGAVPKEDLEALRASLTRTVKEGRVNLAKLGNSVGETSDKYGALSKKVALADQALGRVNQRIRGFGTATQQLGSLFRQFFRYAVGYGVLYQMLAAIRAVISGIVDLQKSLKSIQAITGSTLDDMNSIGTAIKTVALATKFSVSEISDAGRILAQAGVKPEDFTSVLSSVATFAAATESSIAVAADLVSTMRNVYKELDDQTIANQLTKAINISKLTAEDLKTILSRGAQVAKSYNLTSDQFLAAVTVLRNAGIKASTVATGLRQGLIELLSPDDKTIAALKQRYAELGSALSEEAIKARFFAFSQQSDPLLSVLREFRRIGFTGSAKKEFQRVFDVRANNAITALIDNLDQLQAASTKLTFGNSAFKASQTQMEALANSMSNLGAAITVLSGQMGEGLVVSLDSVVDTATKAISALTELDSKVKALGGEGVASASGTGLFAGVVAATSGERTSLPARAGKFAAGSILGTVGSLAAQDLATKAGAGEKLTSIISNITGLLFPLLSITAFGQIRSKREQLKGTGETLKALFKYFGSFSLFITGVSKVFGKLFLVLKGNPIISGITLAITAVSALAKLFGSDAIASSNKKLSQAIRNFDAAVAERDKQIEQFSEFKLSTDKVAAKPGTTAATIETLRKNVSDTEGQIRAVFKTTSATFSTVKDLLLRLNNEGFEAKSKLRTDLLNELKTVTGIKIGKGGISDVEIADISAAVADQKDSAKALQESLRDTIIGITDTQGELTLTQQAILHSFRELSKSSGETYRKLVGITAATASEVTDLQIQLLHNAQVYLDSAPLAAEKAAKVSDEIDATLKALVQSISSAKSPEAVREKLLSIRVTLEKIGLNADDFLQRLLDSLHESLSAFDQEKITNKAKTTESRISKFLGFFNKPTPSQKEINQRSIQTRFDAISAAKDKRDAAQTRLTTLKDKAVINGVPRADALLVMSSLESTIAKQSSIITKNSNQLVAMREAEINTNKTNEALNESNDRLVKATEAKRKEAASTFNSPEFKAANPQLTKSQQALVDLVTKPGSVLTEPVIKSGKPTKELRTSPAFDQSAKFASDFRSRQFKEQLAKTFKVDSQKAEESVRLRQRLDEQQRLNLSAAIDTNKKLGELDNNIIQGKIDFLKSRSEIPGLKKNEKIKVGNELLVEQQKQEKNLIAAGERDRSIREKLFDRRNKATSEVTLAEEERAAEFNKQIKVLSKSFDKRLQSTGTDNPIVLLANLRASQLQRQIDVQKKIIAASKAGLKSEQQGLDATDKLKDLKVQQFKDQKELEATLKTNAKRVFNKQNTDALKVLKGQQASISRSLDFALQQGNSQEINRLMDLRLSTFREITKVELARLHSDQADSATIQRFIDTRSALEEQLNSAFIKATQEIKADEERFRLQRARPSEKGNFKEAGRRAALGVPLSVNAQVQTLETNLAVTKAQLAENNKLLKDLQVKNNTAAGLNITEGERAAFAAKGTTNRKEATDALQAEQALINKSNELERSFGNLQEEYSRLNLASLNFLETGFNLTDLSARLDASKSSITNLGTTIQEELVKGFEDAGDAAAAALVDGESFTDGLRKSFAEMFKKIARDMVKSGFLKLASMFLGGFGGFAASFFAGSQEKKAKGGTVGDGGVIHGPGTGTSDSVQGFVVNSKGQVTRGLQASDGEGIVKASSMNVLGKDFLDMINTQPKLIANLLTASAARSIKRATGGMVGDIKKLSTTNASGTTKSKGGLEYNFSANINVGSQEGSDVPLDTLQKIDQGITQRIGEYMQMQLRPGGLLSAARR